MRVTSQHGWSNYQQWCFEPPDRPVCWRKIILNLEGWGRGQKKEPTKHELSHNVKVRKNNLACEIPIAYATMITGCSRDRGLLRVGPSTVHTKQSGVVREEDWRFKTWRTTAGVSKRAKLIYLDRWIKTEFSTFEMCQNKRKMNFVPLLSWLLKTADIHNQVKK